jgi:hypothetical protein
MNEPMRRMPMSAVDPSTMDAQPMLDELRELPPRPSAPTPSWLDVVDD